MIKLFVGLGNPGLQYEDTRHNAGFWWLAQLAQQWGSMLTMDKAYQGCIARASKDGVNRWLLMPQTFMNLSGHSVAALAHFYKIDPSEILIVHDELDLAPGVIKLKYGGGHAGHNGLKSLHAQLATPDYWRLRVGIGHPGDKALVHGWVLGKPSLADRQLIDRAISHSLAALPLLLEGDMRSAAQQIHSPV